LPLRCVDEALGIAETGREPMADRYIFFPSSSTEPSSSPPSRLATRMEVAARTLAAAASHFLRLPFPCSRKTGAIRRAPSKMLDGLVPERGGPELSWPINFRKKWERPEKKMRLWGIAS